MSHEVRERIGFVGLGIMGGHMARRLTNAGASLRVFDSDRGRMDKVAAASVRTCNSPGEVAEGTDITFVVVATDEQVRDVVLGPNGVLTTAQAGSVIIICSSVLPQTCRNIAETAGTRGVGTLSAALARAEKAARDGTLVFLVGGNDALLARCKPVLQVLGQEICHLGNDVGAGQIGKIVNNLLLWAYFLATTEGLSLAHAAGVDREAMRQAIVVSTAEYTVPERWNTETFGRWAEKDMRNALDLADELGLYLPLSSLVKEQVKGIKRGWDLTIPIPWWDAVPTES